jgi:hypothetical protein
MTTPVYAFLLRNFATLAIQYGDGRFEIKASVIEPGCKTLTYVNAVPPGVTPGRWRVEGVDAKNAGDLSAANATTVASLATAHNIP